MPTDDSWPEASQLIEHRQWRPEWTSDRPCLYWYLTFENQPAFWSACHELTSVLEAIESVDVIPHEWLHLTLLEVGFVDEVDEHRLAAVVAAASEALEGCPPLQLELGPLSTMVDSVVLRVSATPALLDLQRRLDQALRAIGGGVSAAEPFWPHVSLGYLNQPCERSSIIGKLRADAAVDALDDLVIVVSEPQLTFAAVTRERDHYQWRVEAVVALGADAEQDLTG
ncbi:2'-5' RNA ligase family protein [Nocardioides sp.]|uniref:2'-5' RNA ligase family protein n=1 Tax=Nocardioides sp. TaxID=35761 RepID=UPI003D145BB2